MAFRKILDSQLATYFSTLNLVGIQGRLSFDDRHEFLLRDRPQVVLCIRIFLQTDDVCHASTQTFPVPSSDRQWEEQTKMT